MNLGRLLRLVRRGRGGAKRVDGVDTAQIELRIPDALFTAVRLHVEDFQLGEEAGFLICSVAHRPGAVTLLAREWHAIPSDDLQRHADEYVSGWPAKINSRMLERALQIGGTLVVVHSHGTTHAPTLSVPDRRNARQILAPASRLLDPKPTGTVVLGEETASGLFWTRGHEIGELSRLVVVGTPIVNWPPKRTPTASTRDRLKRQTAALGIQSDRLLAAASVAVIGTSGGGSHVCQQLAFQGIGRIVPIDDELVEQVNRSRMIGSKPADVSTTKKTGVMERLIFEIDPEITVDALSERFPSPHSLELLKSVDVVVACVDRFDVRAQINAFCRRHHLPLVDIGLNIETNDEGELVSADGQIICSLPDSPCMQCTPLLSDAVLEREKQDRPRGYDERPDAQGDPQVVSMNGTLASEAANIVLDLITGYAAGARGARWWQYEGRTGTLYRADVPPHRHNCPACGEWGHGDAAI